MSKYTDKERIIDALVEINSKCVMPTDWHEGLNRAIDYIKHVPTTGSRPKGKWVKDRYCSFCEWDKKDFDYISGWSGNFCPNCGTRMKGEERE